jgi:hypothetical protein
VGGGVRVGGEGEGDQGRGEVRWLGRGEGVRGQVTMSLPEG